METELKEKETKPTGESFVETPALAAAVEEILLLKLEALKLENEAQRLELSKLKKLSSFDKKIDSLYREIDSVKEKIDKVLGKNSLLTAPEALKQQNGADSSVRNRENPVRDVKFRTHDQEEPNLTGKNQNQARVERNQAEVERNQAVVEQNQADVERNQTEIKQNQAEIEQNPTEIKRNLAETEQNQAEIEQNQVETEQNQAEIEQNQAEIEQNQTEIKRNQTEIKRNQTEMERNPNDSDLPGNVNNSGLLAGISTKEANYNNKIVIIFNDDNSLGVRINSENHDRYYNYSARKLAPVLIKNIGSYYGHIRKYININIREYTLLFIAIKAKFGKKPPQSRLLLKLTNLLLFIYKTNKFGYNDLAGKFGYSKGAEQRFIRLMKGFEWIGLHFTNKNRYFFIKDEGRKMVQQFIKAV